MVGFGRSRERLETRAASGARSTRRPSRWRTPSTAPTPASPAGRWARCPTQVPAALDAAAAGLRGHRRRLDEAARWWRRSHDERFVGGHPVAGRRDDRRRARARRPVRGRRLVPDPARALVGAALRAPAPAGPLLRRPPDGASTPPPTTGCWPRSATCPHVLANVLVAQAARALAQERRAAAARRAELPRRHPGGGREHRHLDRHLPGQPRRARRRDRRDRRAACGRWRARCARATAEAVSAWNERRPGRSPPAAGGRPRRRAGARAAADGAQPPRYRRAGGAGARQGGPEHRRLALAPASDKPHRRDDAVDRRRRARPRAPRG